MKHTGLLISMEYFMNCDPSNSPEGEPFETLEEQYYQEESEYLNTDDGYYSGSGYDEI